MRLLIVGTLKGQLTAATKIAMENGATVTHAEDNEQAMRLRQPLRYSWMPRVLTGGIAVIAACGGIGGQTGA